MELESAARELKMLAAKERLTPSELDRAKSLMVELKKQGMLNAEITELAGGRWTESTVKGYTKGVRTTAPEPWKSATALFSEMLSRNLHLTDVSEVVAISAEVEATGASLGDVVSFMKQLKEKQITLGQLSETISVSAELEAKDTSPSEIAGFLRELAAGGVDVPVLVSVLRDWHRAGLTPMDAQLALGYRAQLEDAGFDINALTHVAEAARKLGSPSEVLEAVAKYGNLAEQDHELQNKRGELEALTDGIKQRSQKLDALGKRLEGLQNEVATVEKALETYRRLQAIGFDEKTLDRLASAADKYGGAREVLTAVNSFDSFSEIRAASEEIRSKLRQQKTALKGLEDKYSHLDSAIDMCQKLFREYRFGLDGITALLAVAKIHGDPVRVLKAVEAYGQIKAMGEEAQQLEAKIEQLKRIEAQYESKNEAILGQFEALNAKAIEVGRMVGGIQEQMKRDPMAGELLDFLRSPASVSYERSAPLVLVMLRVIAVWAAINKNKFNYPSLVDKNLQEAIRLLGGS